MNEVAIEAVEEVGNPTILATLTVIASMMPMAFVRGLMGPYMAPMPIGASLAMVFSLLVALTISPWLAFRLFRKESCSQGDGPNSEPPEDTDYEPEEQGAHAIAHAAGGGEESDIPEAKPEGEADEADAESDDES